MQRTRNKRLPPKSEIRSAVLVAARLGHGLLTVARRHGISTSEAWGMLAESVDATAEQAYRRGHREGRLSMMPNLPKGFAA
jgi:hypothetical protein